MAKRYETKFDWFEADGTPFNWDRATKHDRLMIEKLDLTEALAETHPHVANYRRLQAVEKKLADMEYDDELAADQKRAQAGPGARVSNRLKTGGE